MCNQSWGTFRSVAVSCIKHGSNIQVFLRVDAYLPCFNVFGPLEKMPIDCGKPAWVWEMLRLSFLGPSPCGVSSVVPKEGSLVIQGSFGWCCCLKSTSNDQYPELLACRIGTAASSDIFHLPFHPFLITTRLGSVGGVMDVALSFETALGI